MAKKIKNNSDMEKQIKENNELMKLTEDELIKKINTKVNQINRKLKQYGEVDETHANIYRRNIKTSLNHLNLSERDLMTKTGNLSRSKKLYEGKSKQALINQYRQYEKLVSAPQYKSIKNYKAYVKEQQEKMSKSATLSHRMRINSFKDTMLTHTRKFVAKDFPDLSRIEIDNLSREILNDLLNDSGGVEEYYNDYIEWMNDNNEKKQYDSTQRMDTQIEGEIKERYLSYAKQKYEDRKRMARNPIPNKPRYQRQNKTSKGKVNKTPKGKR